MSDRSQQSGHPGPTGLSPRAASVRAADRAADRARLVAERGHLRGLSAQLRRRRRRRHRRPRGRSRLACPTSATSASTPSGSRPGTSRRWRTVATTSPTTAPSIRVFGTPRRRRGRSSPMRSRMGIRTIVDIVPNHVSDQHPWFQAALAARPGLARAGALLVPTRVGAPTASGCRPTGARTSRATTWTRVTEPDGQPGEWYLHLFSAAQPDLNWDHPDVRREHEDILRFWFDRGAAGVRIDSAALLVKDPRLPEVPAAPGARTRTPAQDRDELHDIYRSWRAIADGYPGRRILVGEVWLPDVERFARYLRPDELHTAFNFDFLARPWDAHELRASIDAHARGPRARRRARDVGPVQPRRDAAGDPVRPRGQLVRVPDQAPRRADRPRARSPARAGGGAARGGAARLAVHLPGRRARTRRGDRPARSTRSPDPMYHRSGGTRPGPRRLPGARCPGRATRQPFGFSPPGASTATVAPPARPLGGPERRGPAGRPRLDPPALPVRAAHPARRARPGRRPDSWLPAARACARLRTGRRGSSAITNLSDGPVALPRGTERAARERRGRRAASCRSMPRPGCGPTADADDREGGADEVTERGIRTGRACIPIARTIHPMEEVRP